jgi:hypothetical protein
MVDLQWLSQQHAGARETLATAAGVAADQFGHCLPEMEV